MSEQNSPHGWEGDRRPPPDPPDPRPRQTFSHHGSPSANKRSYCYSSSSTDNPGSQSSYRQPSQQATGYGTSQSTNSYQPQTSTYGSYGSSQQNSQQFSGYSSQTATSTRYLQQYTQAARDPYEDRSDYSGRTK
ncbi:hypothetical protein ABVK25_008908 [Lepraria finkii]|uniref:Uncharacterized protein n=1 Tax=Lepraria finkii TaxID=1340010 RepID=A0ABR4AYW9_9LECA